MHQPHRFSDTPSLSPMSPHANTFDDMEQLKSRAFQMLPSPSRSQSGNNGELDCLEPLAHTALHGQPPSPPASPWAAHVKKSGTATFDFAAQASDDPPLYTGDNNDAFRQPMFPPLWRQSAHNAWAQRNAYHFVNPKSKRDRRIKRYLQPTEENYLEMPSFSSSLSKSFNSNPGDYLKQTRDELLQQRALKRVRISRTGGSSSSVARPKVPAIRQFQRKEVKHPSKGLEQVKKLSHVNAHSSGDAFDRTKAPHTRAPSIKRPEDIHFESLRDFSPPTASLPANNKSLKIEWSSHNPLDLSADPHRHLLHEAELALASTLRLSCATYLCSKRRIFLKLQEAHQAGKEFRKTDAQQACQIDVNKASKLWVAFEKVGWFDRSRFEKDLT